MRKRKGRKRMDYAVHQHRDERGNVFGQRHLVSAKHKKKKTQLYHERTVAAFASEQESKD